MVLIVVWALASRARSGRRLDSSTLAELTSVSEIATATETLLETDDVPHCPLRREG